ncbi:hypothetical protein BT93_F2278 [Corymbia citriodora subsp. variegata]|nr:hypothetical protein BT93_F2278 [Corymbia citriodora subsp. variegata]
MIFAWLFILYGIIFLSNLGIDGAIVDLRDFSKSANVLEAGVGAGSSETENQSLYTVSKKLILILPVLLDIICLHRFIHGPMSGYTRSSGIIFERHSPLLS